MAANSSSSGRRVRQRTLAAALDDDMTEREDDELADMELVISNALARGSATQNAERAQALLPGAATLASPSDSQAVSAEDDDYRSETWSETNAKDLASSSASQQPKHTSQAFTNHRDLSSRLRSAVYGGAENESNTLCFDESVVGADVVLRVRNTCSLLTDEENESSDTSVKRFYTHRFMLAASSEPFRAMLTGGMRESTQREVEIVGVDAAVVEKMLVYIYTGEVTVDLQNVVGLTIGAEMYELVGLREICKSFVLIHAQDIFRDPQMVHLPEKIMLEIVENDDLQIKEIALMEALVLWGEARVDSSAGTILEILSDVMEHVRFPTMSVSDLYSKVRPLVRDNVIHESLLTEALFFHLKWGTHQAKATNRMRPRAGTAALRKRKRVSFTQHVSFLNQ